MVMKLARLVAPCVVEGPRSRAAIALTFDDGPSESTPQILEILDRHRARATFFQCGAHVKRLGWVAREVSAAGHEIGNHTHTHPRLWLRSRRFIAGEIDQAQEALTEAHGAGPRLFRAPYGIPWAGLRSAQARHGLLGVMWTAMARDWRLPAKRIVERLLAGARNGAIFCLHDGREMKVRPDIRATVEALRTLVPALVDRGFRLETVSQLLGKN